MERFVHLHVRSAFSFLWGTFHPEDLVSRAKEMECEAVAMTDLDGLYGAVRFCLAAQSAGVRPIVGAETTLWDGSRIVLLAKDFSGYRNLCRILSRAHLENPRGHPRAPREALTCHRAGLIAITGGRASRLRLLLERGRREEAFRNLATLRDIFPEPESLYVALQNHGLPGDEAVMAEAAALAARAGLPVVATNEAAFLHPEDHVIHRSFVGVQREVHHRDVEPLPNNRFCLVSADEMARRVPVPEALENTLAIARLCEGFELPMKKIPPPRFHNDVAKAERLLAVHCLQGLARHHNPVPLLYLSRLDRELAAIRGKGLPDYFLLVREVREFARKQGIRCTVRGSAAGSLVIHALLGGVDPVAHELLFARFLNEGRGDLPDVDLDFDSDRRDEVLTWVMERFSGRAAMVGTILTLRARGAVRLIGRALGYSLPDIDRLSRGLPSSMRHTDLPTALDRFPELEGHPILNEPELLLSASRVSGLPFAHSVHLGGVALTPEAVDSFSPVEISAKGFPVIHYDKDDVDALGIVKLDLLGLRMHTALRKTCEALRAAGSEVDLDQLPLDDRATYKLLQNGDTLGVFQLESPGQRGLVQRLKPRCFPDIIAEISLFRPGPVSGEMVTPFVRRRNGRERVDYPHPVLERALKETYGIILFQEQVLEVAHDFAGLSYAEADAFRRAMTKNRTPSEMEKIRERFMEGARKRGHDRGLSEQVFEMVASFAAYGFCKAHAASFAHITWQSAWLKTHHPREFYVGLLNAGHVGSYPPLVIVNEARRRGIPVLAPHVNHSGPAYKLQGGAIRPPLGVIRGLGEATTGISRSARGEGRL